MRWGCRFLDRPAWTSLPKAAHCASPQGLPLPLLRSLPSPRLRLRGGGPCSPVCGERQERPPAARQPLPREPWRSPPPKLLRTRKRLKRRFANVFWSAWMGRHAAAARLGKSGETMDESILLYPRSFSSLIRPPAAGWWVQYNRRRPLFPLLECQTWIAACGVCECGT